MATLLQQAIDLAKKGDRAGAERLLQQVLTQQPNNEAAWMWLSAVTGDVLIKQEALQRVLKINPAHPLANKGIARFGGGKVPPQTQPPASSTGEGAEPLFADVDFEAGAGIPAIAWGAVGNAPTSPTPPPPAGASEVPALDFDFDLAPGPVTPTQTSPAYPSGAETPLTPVPDFDFFGMEPTPIEPAATKPPTPAFTEEAALSEPSPFDLMFPPTPTPPPAAPQKPSPFSDLMGNAKTRADAIPGGFNLDEPPIFDIDLGNLASKPSAPANSWDEPPAFSFDGSLDDGPIPVPALIEDTFSDDLFADSQESIDSTALEEMLAQTGDKPREEADDTPPFLTEPEAAIDLDEEADAPEELTPEEAYARTLRRKRRQNQMLIGFTAVFTMAIFFCCLLYYYLYEMTDTYTLIPALAGAQVTEKAGKPDENGVTVLKFRGYPAARITVTWSPNPQAKTCADNNTTGLKISYMNGDKLTSSSFRNDLSCSGEKCSYDKNLNPPITISTVTVTYKCAKNVAVTLSK